MNDFNRSSETCRHSKSRETTWPWKSTSLSFNERKRDQTCFRFSFIPLAKCELTLVDVRPIDQSVGKQEVQRNSVRSNVEFSLRFDFCWLKFYEKGFVDPPANSLLRSGRREPFQTNSTDSDPTTQSDNEHGDRHSDESKTQRTRIERFFIRTQTELQEDVASKASLNYDVDIIHSAEVHQTLRERAPIASWRQVKDEIETIVLKWSAFSYDPES